MADATILRDDFVEGRRISGSVSTPIWRAIDHATAHGMTMDHILETALYDWARRNNLMHIMMPTPKVEKPPKPPKAPPAPKPPKVKPPKHPARILGLQRNAPTQIIIFEVRRLGCAIDRVRFSGWDEKIDARIQLAPFIPIQGMGRWEDLLGRTVDIKPSGVPGVEGTLVARPQPDLEADLAWLEQQDLDEADRAALAGMRRGT